MSTDISTYFTAGSACGAGLSGKCVSMGCSLASDCKESSGTNDPGLAAGVTAACRCDDGQSRLLPSYATFTAATSNQLTLNLSPSTTVGISNVCHIVVSQDGTYFDDNCFELSIVNCAAFDHG